MLRIIGDVHGKHEEYVSIANGAEYSIQLGDMGFEYAKLQELDSKRHRVLGGNHDNYTEQAGKFYCQTEHFLGNFGVHRVAGYDFFYVRGGHSIDKEYRREGVDWFHSEQISYKQANEALALYARQKPQYVITHECPSEVISAVSTKTTWKGREIRPSMTAMLLQHMLDTHKPKFWWFGHHHKDWEGVVGGCKFRCLNELSYMDLPEKSE